MRKHISKHFQWLISHAFTVFSCVVIITIGMGAVAYSSTSTTIGENISTNGTLTVLSNSNLATTTISGGDLTVDTDTLYVDSKNKRVGIGTSLPNYQLDIDGDISADRIRFISSQPQPLVSFVFDDGRVEDYTVMKPIFDAQGEIAVSAIITDQPGTDGYLTWVQIQELQSAGWEITSHTKSHPYLTTLTETQLEEELLGSKQALEDQGIIVRNFVYPYGDRDETVRRIVRKYYRSARATYSGPNPVVLSTYNLSATQMDDLTLLPTYKADVDIAESENKWVIFYIHPTRHEEQEIITMMDELIDYIQAKDIPIVTIDQALDLVGNVFDGGDNVAVGERGLRVGSSFDNTLWADAATRQVGIATGKTSLVADLQVGEGVETSFSTDKTLAYLYANKNGGSTITDLKGLDIYLRTNDHVAGTEITNAYGAYITVDCAGSVGEKIKNAYGIYIPAPISASVTNPVSAFFGSKVGIGTTTPSALLDVYASSSAYALNVNQTLTGGIVNFQNATGSVFTIINSGDVGIGTESPSAKLEVAGELNVAGNIKFGDGGEDYIIHNGDSDSLFGFAGGDRFYMKIGNKEAIDIYEGDWGGGTIDRINLGKNNYKVQINSLWSDNNGNVGIGTTSPALKLDLYGGAIRAFNTASSTCDSTTRGAIFYNQENDSFWGCKTTGWVQLDN